MVHLLHVAASPRGAASFSRRVAASLIETLARDDPALTVVERDLAADPPPHPDAAFAEAILMAEGERGDVDRRALERSERLIAELEAADLVVVSTAMHNFAAPSALKAWIDHVVRPGRTFRPTPAGKVGLVADRPTLAIVACGGRFAAGGPASQEDHLGPYLRYVFAAIGVTNFTMLRLEQLRRGPEAIERELTGGGRRGSRRSGRGSRGGEPCCFRRRRRCAIVDARQATGI